MTKSLSIIRYPKTQNRSLKAWNSADELSLEYLKENELKKNTAIYNDRFGYLSCHLPSPLIISTYKSKEKAIAQNYNYNKLGSFTSYNLFDTLPEIKIAVLPIPKSLGLFEYFLSHIHKNATSNVQVICSFMTRHFTPKMISIASNYFENVEQSKAKKKARLLILKDKKEIEDKPSLINEISFNGIVFKQYFGVFSANTIDYATQFLIQNLKIQTSDQKILDLASGNGVLAHAAHTQNSEAEIHLIDDFSLAIESSKLNLTHPNFHFHYNDVLADFENDFFDVIVSNPPFHFEHENNIEVSLSLFKQVFDKLKPSGRFQLVSNQHLNYKTHLSKLFNKVSITAENDKFIVYECLKA